MVETDNPQAVNGIPSHDTFWRVFSALDPERLQHSFLEWMRAVSTMNKGEIIGVDGKKLRGTHH